MKNILFFFIIIITSDTSIYTKIHTDLTVSNFMGSNILKGFDLSGCLKLRSYPSSTKNLFGLPLTEEPE